MLSDAFEPEGETSDLADLAIMHLTPQLRRSPRGSSARDFFVQAQV